MCLGVPGQIVAIESTAELLMGRVDFGGVVRDVCLSFLPQAQVGQYVLVHVGFAISLLDQDEAMSTLETLRGIDALAAEAQGAEGAGR